MNLRELSLTICFSRSALTCLVNGSKNQVGDHYMFYYGERHEIGNLPYFLFLI